MTVERIKVSLDPDQVKWLDEMIDENIFASRSHGIRYLISYFQRLKGVSV